MQIHEITSRRTDEGILKDLKTVVTNPKAVAGGVATYAANALSRSMGGGAVGDTRSFSPGAAQSKAAELSGPVIKQLADQYYGSWSKSVQDLIGKTQMPGGGKATSIKNVPEQELGATFDNMVQQLLTRLTGYQLSDISQLADKIDPNASSYIVKQVNDMIAQANRLKTQILNTEPKKAKDAWQQYVTYLGNAANIARFQGGSGAKGTSVQSIPARVKAAGLTAQQMGIPAGTTVHNTGNQTINDLLTSIGVKVQS